MSRQTESSERRDALVRAASQVIHRQGYARTTLADIAQAADVALGSVYYYFKAKDEIVVAITDRRLAHLRQKLGDVAAASGPQAGLGALIQLWTSDKEVDALYGCPIGSLCYELARQRGTLGEEAARPLRFLLQWSEEQFGLLGPADQAPALALQLVVALQGASLVANALEDSEVIARETDRLQAWLGSLVPKQPRRARRPPAQAQISGGR
ncbi:MAG: TetR/AcrR family transcriptional regulator [Rubrivivax sp.]|nr:TetR/AcrR family transcriptional regulator [Rubrivivax sp.]